MEAKKGYGLVAKSIMQDPTIPIEAKCIYALLCTYADENGMCYPKVETIQSQLQIGHERYNKYMNVLIDKGIITRTKRYTRKEKGQIQSHNYYQINHEL